MGEFRRSSGIGSLDLATLEEAPDVLDLSWDADYHIDRRLVLALALIVDSPEEG